jgi:hypothetical protein
MAKVSSIVVSQGLEIDNLKLSMDIPMVNQYIRKQEKDKYSDYSFYMRPKV